MQGGGDEEVLAVLLGSAPGQLEVGLRVGGAAEAGEGDAAVAQQAGLAEAVTGLAQQHERGVVLLDGVLVVAELHQERAALGEQAPERSAGQHRLGGGELGERRRIFAGGLQRGRPAHPDLGLACIAGRLGEGDGGGELLAGPGDVARIVERAPEAPGGDEPRRRRRGRIVEQAAQHLHRRCRVAVDGVERVVGGDLGLPRLGGCPLGFGCGLCHAVSEFVHAAGHGTPLHTPRSRR